MIIPRIVSAGFLIFAVSVGAAAASLESEVSPRLLEQAWSDARLMAEEAAQDREEWMDAPGCWTPQGASTGLGLPKKVCLSRAGVRIPSRQGSPFGHGGGMLIEGAPFSGVFWISGGVRQTDGWLLIGSIWSGEDGHAACGSLNKAGLVVEFRIDGRSRPVPGTLNVRGYAYDSAPSCSKPAPSVDIPYSR